MSYVPTVARLLLAAAQWSLIHRVSRRVRVLCPWGGPFRVQHVVMVRVLEIARGVLREVLHLPAALRAFEVLVQGKFWHDSLA